ncbi:bL21 family ribosomal protein [Candidatus Carsonella ruddii]|uniref:Uncharacterized protein n=1 Tax=Carsonella ruddii TaxID=114186 RepID=A0AAE7G5Y9_CARRU|nr:bL21 family ribosomal protein [Candidatus Carsonella ruddii]AGS06649.1 hypothetical protein CRDC_00825 [Candidatus Carsonella ruddii DC]ALA96885.1 hypothetical protein AMC76_00870 [Candidatus Carsonella ruddii]QLK14121.1 hypothetical protein FK493_00875 [Candidatus Carsonella ruddii]
MIASFYVGNKIYFSKENNYIILDYINKQVGSRLFFNHIDFIYNKNFYIEKNLHSKIFTIVVKHFFIKSISLKKKRRKTVLKNNICYKKKSLLFCQKIII